MSPFLRRQSSTVCDASKVNVYYDSTNNLHRDIGYHPECPDRIKVCVNAMERMKCDDINSFDIGGHECFTDDELNYARSMLVLAHSEVYVNMIEQKCRGSKAKRLEEGKSALGYIGYADSGDTYMTTETYDVCLRAAATWIRAVDDVLASTSQNNRQSSFALTRPPGHHATRSLVNGFCFFNFAAAATIHAIRQGKRVSVLDWDVHYGQGVSDILQDEPLTRYVSLHQIPAFPYQGEKREVSGNQGNILTVPIEADSTWTCGYKSLFTTHALPFLVDTDWKPDLLLVCAGYDALADDELASVNLVPSDYYNMIVLLRERLDGEGLSSTNICLGLEGGYRVQPDNERGLSAAFTETLKSLLK